MSDKPDVAVYDAGSIEIYEFPENVRKRPGMFIGGATQKGAQRCYVEIIDNCVDEFTAGFGKRISVYYDLKTKFIIVRDRARGIPVEIHPKTKESTLTTVYTKLNAGGKFGGSQSSYSKSGGLHGVGASCVNALSDSFEAWTCRAGTWYYQAFSKGYAKTKVVKKDPPAQFAKEKAGTIVRYHLDPEIFGSHVADPRKMVEDTRNLAILNPGLETELFISDKVFKFKFDEGLTRMVLKPELKDIVLGKPFRLYVPGEIDIALCWYDDGESSFESYVNSSHTINGGTHVDGFKQALTKILRDATKTQYESKYWMMGLRGAMNWRMNDPVYRGQTKDELASEVESQVRDMIQQKLSLWFTQNPNLVKALADRAAKFKKTDDKYKLDVKSVKALEIASKDEQVIDPSKLIQADPGVPPHLRELVLVEGESAGGTARQAKHPHHEILKLRGVSINAQRQTSGKVLANAEIRLLIKALGIKPHETDLSKMRVGSIVILTDADPDGKHIASLLLAFFKIYYPEIVRQRKLRSVNGPLFMAQHKDVRFFGDSREEVTEKFQPSIRQSVRVTRFKGWGEAQPDQLDHIAFNPKTRRLIVLSMNDEDEIRIGHIMGNDVEHRRELLGTGTANQDEGDE